MRILLYIFISFCIFSCTGNTVYEKPQGLIPKDTMVMLLQDLYVANASKFVANKANQKYKIYTHLVYHTYKIDSLRFTNSNIYYTSRIDEYEELLRQVKTNLDTLIKVKATLIKSKKLVELKYSKEIDFIENIKSDFDSLNTFFRTKFSLKKFNSTTTLEHLDKEEKIGIQLDSLTSNSEENQFTLRKKL